MIFPERRRGFAQRPRAGGPGQVPARDARPAHCWVRGCEADGPYVVPVLRIALRGSDHVSRVELPVRVCAAHRDVFGKSFLTSERRATMERSVTSRGRELPDWSRTDIEFVAP